MRMRDEGGFVTRVAAIDCGTNSIRLLIADVDAEVGTLTDVVRTMTVVRLGQGVDRTGQFAPEALERTLAATDEYARACREHGVGTVRFVATSATRDASNRGVFIDGVRERLGVTPEVISGQEEAELSFAGAVSAVGDTGPLLVVDIGGGSTEVVLGERFPSAAHSMDVGCVRLTERHLAGDPPNVDQRRAAVADVRAALDHAAVVVPLGQARAVVGVAGSVTTVTAHALGLDRYDPVRIDGSRLPLAQVLDSCEALLDATRGERAAMPFMHPGRVDVIGSGALVWREVLLRVQAEAAAKGGRIDTVITSEHDILDGIALAVARA